MTTLGTYPSRRYNRSWITQRLTNRYPEWAVVRQNAFSTGQQFLNPIGLEIEQTLQSLTIEKINYFLSTCDLSILEYLYRIDLSPGMNFNYTEDSNGNKTYIPPSVYATIDSVEYQLTQAEYNDINTLAYENIPSRIEDSGTNYTYLSVLPETSISDIPNTVINNLTIPGHLYITLKGNSSWTVETPINFYFSKIFITGTTRKDTTLTETIPLRYNGTFKTINEWKSITSIDTAYLDSTATITVEIFPWNAESVFDNLNLFIDRTKEEKIQFLKLGTQDYGSSLISESFAIQDLNAVRETGIEDKNPNYEIELLNTNLENITINSFCRRPQTNYIYAIDDNKFYVYDFRLPFPNVLNLTDENDEVLMDLYSDEWIVSRGNTATIKTRTLSVLDAPYKVRWTITKPDGIKYSLALDGTIFTYNQNTWIENLLWEEGQWAEQRIDIILPEAGSYKISIECYYTEDFTNSTLLRTNYLFFAPSITPEIELDLPTALQDSISIGISSDNELWLLKNGINKLNIFFDYFIVDYENNKIWLKEDYTSVRVTI